jgi:hypothetical protein
MNEESPIVVWLKLESRYMSKYLTNKLYLEQLKYGIGRRSKPTHQRVQSGNRLFKEG